MAFASGSTKGDVVRERFRQHRTDDTRHMRGFVLAGLASVLLVPLLVLHTAGAITLPVGPLVDTPKSDESNVADPSQEATEPAAITLSDGTPESTTPSVLRQSGARVTWTATGAAGVQDTYDINVTTSGDMNDDGTLKGAPLMSTTGLTAAGYDVAVLQEGSYYFQVRACRSAVCGNWSMPWQFAIDATAPGAPIAAVTSGPHQRTVTVSGSSERGASVTAVINEAACTATADEDGIWSCTFNEPFDYGSYQASVTATDPVGNVSASSDIDFSISELFVAAQITGEELPEVIEILPVTETPKNTVFQQPMSVIDSVNHGAIEPSAATEEPATPVLTTEGGIVKASDSGWQVFGLPWFIWLGSLGSVLAGWRVFGSPVPRQLASIFTL